MKTPPEGSSETTPSPPCREAEQRGVRPDPRRFYLRHAPRCGALRSPVMPRRGFNEVAWVSVHNTLRSVPCPALEEPFVLQLIEGDWDGQIAVASSFPSQPFAGWSRCRG